MPTRLLQRTIFPGPAGGLEGLLHRPAREARFGAVVSHPHPLHGTMDNKVAYRVARELEELGGLVLRFNFRGAGRSAGEHDEGRGEREDLRAAIRFLRESGGASLPLVLAGVSFGAVMSATVALSEPAVQALLLVASPRRLFRLDQVLAWARPVAFLHGELDEHGPLVELRDFARRRLAPTRVHVIEGAGHLFEEHQAELREAVRDLAHGGALGPRLAAEAV